VKQRTGRLLIAVITACGGAGVLAGTGVLGVEVASAAPSCTSNVGGTGLSAAIVATSGQTINTTTPIDATGCDIGIYVGNSAPGVTIEGVTVSGANGAGILAEDTTGVTIENSTVTGNGDSPPDVAQAFGISLFGVSGSTVTNNTVTNNGRGGIGLMDYGPFDPGALTQPGPSQGLVESNGDTISDNKISGAYRGCAIVLAVFNTGNTMANDNVMGNTVTASVGAGPLGPDVGGIVVQSNGPGSTIGPVTVSGNTVTDSNEAGIIVHAEAPHSKTMDVSVTGNTVTGANNWGLTNGPTATVGVLVSAGPVQPPANPSNVGTTVTGNTISGQFYGVWSTGPNPPTLSGNTISVASGGTPYYVPAAPGSGYWEAASDGGIFAFGGATFHGSMGGKALNAPIVGLAATEDQGGYWEAASDGGIFSFGDAVFEGSMGGKHLNQPIVGLAGTPYVPAQNGAPATPGGLGYWEVAKDGGVFAFGDATFHGSMGGKPLNAPIVGIAPTPTTFNSSGVASGGNGYWEVASDGGVFNFGDAGFFGSMGGKPLNAPIVGLVSTPSGQGYWEVASDGGVFAFGDATFHGSMGGKPLNQPIVSIIASPTGNGYWEVAKDGGVFAFGDATYAGSQGGKPLNAPIVASAGVGVTFSG
jgi:parallel beta-helix repeat protein